MWDGTTWVDLTPNSPSISWWNGPMYAGPDSNVWIVNNSALLLYDGQNWTEFTTSNSSLPSNNITGFTDDGTNLYLATSDQGYVVFDGTNFTSFNTANSNLPDNNVLAITYSNNELWMVCSGDNLVKVANNQYFTFTNSNLSTATYLAIDASGNVWISSHGNGLLQFDGSGFSIYNHANQPLIDIWDQILTVEVENIDMSQYIQLSPNPSDRLVQISNTQTAIINELELLDLNGKLLKSIPDLQTYEKVIFDISGLPAGVYFIRFEYKNQRISKKLIVY